MERKTMKRETQQKIKVRRKQSHGENGGSKGAKGGNAEKTIKRRRQ